jgi:hypothetical protein
VPTRCSFKSICFKTTTSADLTERASSALRKFFKTVNGFLKDASSHLNRFLEAATEVDNFLIGNFTKFEAAFRNPFIGLLQ